MQLKAMLAIVAMIVIGCGRNPESTLWPPNVPRVPSEWMPGCYAVEFDTTGPEAHVAKPFILSADIAGGIERRRYYEVYENNARRHLGVWQPVDANSLRVQMPAPLGDATVTIERGNNGGLKATYYVVGDVGPGPSALYAARVRKVDCSRESDSNPHNVRP